jgi:hypothetical protein
MEASARGRTAPSAVLRYTGQRYVVPQAAGPGFGGPLVRGSISSPSRRTHFSIVGAHPHPLSSDRRKGTYERETARVPRSILRSGIRVVDSGASMSD